MRKMKAKKTWKKQNDEGKRKWKLNGCRSTSSSKHKNVLTMNDAHSFGCLCYLVDSFPMFLLFTLCKHVSFFCCAVFCCRWMISKRHVERHCCIFLILLYFNDKRWESSFGEYIRSCAIQMEWIRSDTQLCTESFFGWSEWRMSEGEKIVFIWIDAKVNQTNERKKEI